MTVEGQTAIEEESQSIFADKLHTTCCIDKDVSMCGIVLRGELECDINEEEHCKACLALNRASAYCPRFASCYEEGEE